MSAKNNPTHTKVPPTSGWTGTGPTDMGRIRPSPETPVQPDVGSTWVWVGLGFADTEARACKV